MGRAQLPMVSAMLLTTSGLVLGQSGAAGANVVTLTSPQARPVQAQHGETFHFTLGYLGVAGAKARVAVEKDGEERLRFVGDVQHTFLLQFVFRIRDRFQALFSPSQVRTVRTQLWQHENDYKRYREEAWFEDRVITMERRDKDGERTAQVNVAQRALDPLSALFWVRGQKLDVGDKVVVPTFANNRLFEVHAVVTKEETVRAMGKLHTARRLEATVHKDGQPIPGAHGTFWVSSGEAHIPLRAEANTDYGKVSATLDRMEQP